MKLIHSKAIDAGVSGVVRGSGLRLLFLLGLLVFLPAALVGVLGWLVAGNQRERAVEQYRSLLEVRVAEVVDSVVGAISAAELEVSDLRAIADAPAGEIREVLRQHRLVRAAMVLDSEGTQLYPPVDGVPLSRSEMDFMERSAVLREKGGCFESHSEGAPAPLSGWCTWFWGDGVNALYWMRLKDRRLVALDMSRAALTADVIAALPSTQPYSWRRRSGAASPVAMRVVDERGQVVYRWGRYRHASGDHALVEQRLPPPLSAWRLECFASVSGVASAGVPARLVALIGAGAMAVAMSVLAAFIYGESRRSMREALQRVSFVNQVSHELKTPLTNIRMYTELLEARVDGLDETALRHAHVVGDEAQRLGRLIANVLSFARGQRGALALRLRSGIPDEVVRAVIASFGPAFEQREMTVELTCDASVERRFDHEVLEQIVGNLLSNAEKYAGSGCAVRVSTRLVADALQLTVSDNGPGIPRHAARRIFEPFVRLDDRLTEGVSGTGIGLAIVRQLAQLHGGDVRVVKAQQGAAFEVELKVEES